MTKKISMILMLVLVLPAMVLTTSCAKKKIYSEPSGQSADDAARAERARQDALARQRAFDEQQLKDQAGGRAGGGAGAGMEGGGQSATRSSFVSEDIYFEYDSSALIPEARDVLKRKAEWMRNNPNVSVVIEGHTDERGTVAYNMALGERRAASAMSFLVDLGIPASRMTTVSYGKEKPANPGHNEAAWAANRRVHFDIKK